MGRVGVVGLSAGVERLRADDQRPGVGGRQGDERGAAGEAERPAEGAARRANERWTPRLLRVDNSVQSVLQFSAAWSAVLRRRLPPTDSGAVPAASRALSGC